MLINIIRTIRREYSSKVPDDNKGSIKDTWRIFYNFFRNGLKQDCWLHFFMWTTKKVII